MKSKAIDDIFPIIKQIKVLKEYQCELDMNFVRLRLSGNTKIPGLFFVNKML